jgi:hypothetical protein
MSAVLPAAEPIFQPYPGLRPFLADEAHLYFGRERHRSSCSGGWHDGSWRWSARREAASRHSCKRVCFPTC